MITYASDTTAPFDYQTTATYSCDSGLGLTSGDVVRSCVFSRTSSIGGDWSGTAPTCEGMIVHATVKPLCILRKDCPYYKYGRHYGIWATVPVLF